LADSDGTILGIILIALFFKRIGGTAAFLGFKVIGCDVLAALAHVLIVVV
jgi:hypothetical protein